MQQIILYKLNTVQCLRQLFVSKGKKYTAYLCDRIIIHNYLLVFTMEMTYKDLGYIKKHS